MTQNFGTAKQITTLREAQGRVDSSAKTYPALVGENLGHTTLKFSLPISQVLQMAKVANHQNISSIVSLQNEYEAQRNLMVNHAKKLAQYTLMGLVKSEIQNHEKTKGKVSLAIHELQNNLGKPAYTSLQPMVTNIRACEMGGGDIPAVDVGHKYGQTTGIYNVTLSNKHVLWVVDGQHRLEGFRMVLEFLKQVLRTCRYPKQADFKLYAPNGLNNNQMISEEILEFWEAVYDWAMHRATVSVECHLGLNKHEEQQLFFDLNSKGKKVETGLAFEFDHTDPINKAVKDIVIPILPFVPNLRDKNAFNVVDDGRLTRRKSIKLRKFFVLAKQIGMLRQGSSGKRAVDHVFWQTIISIKHFGEPHWREKTVAAQSVTLKAVAFTIHRLVYGQNSLPREEAIKCTQKIFEAISSNLLSFSFDNPIWSSILVEKAEREKKLKGISEFVQINDEMVQSYGAVDFKRGKVRFGNRHNDIMVLLGDADFVATFVAAKEGLNVRKLSPAIVLHPTHARKRLSGRTGSAPPMRY